MFEDDGYALETLAVRAGQVRSEEGEHSEALYLTSSYVFPSAAEAAARFTGESAGNVYSRYTNPTVRMFEQRIAALEGGEAAVATASGMAAILSICMSLLKSGDRVICSRSVFGTTTALFGRYMEKFGVRVSYVDLTDMDSWKQAVDGSTKLLFMETPPTHCVKWRISVPWRKLLTVPVPCWWWITVSARRRYSARWHSALILWCTPPPNSSMVRAVPWAVSRWVARRSWMS